MDKQATILEKRLRETSEDDQVIFIMIKIILWNHIANPQLVYDALLQQFLTLVNKRDAMIKRQNQVSHCHLKVDSLDQADNLHHLAFIILTSLFWTSCDHHLKNPFTAEHAGEGRGPGEEAVHAAGNLPHSSHHQEVYDLLSISRKSYEPCLTSRIIRRRMRSGRERIFYWRSSWRS